jgi:hypothetical protein
MLHELARRFKQGSELKVLHLVLSFVQSTVRMIVAKVIIPILNLNLKRGFPLPVFPAIDLQNADVRYDDGYILICSDVYYKGGSIKPSVEPLQEQSSTALL